MSNSESESDSEHYYSPNEQFTPKPSNNSVSSKKRPLQSSSSTESPPNSVQTGQGKFVKLQRSEKPESEFPLREDSTMNDATKAFLEQLLAKTEGRVLTQISEVKAEVNTLKQAIDTVKVELFSKVTLLEKQLISVKIELERAQAELRKRNLLVEGIPEKTNESWKETEQLIEQLFNQLGLTVNPMVDDCFRIGKYAPGKVRPILIKLVKLKDKKMIMGNRKRLKGTKIYVNDDLSKDQRTKNAVLRKKEKELRKDHPTAKIYTRAGMLLFKDGSKSSRFTISDDLTIQETETFSTFGVQSMDSQNSSI
jgi:hypothetical protein